MMRYLWPLCALFLIACGDTDAPYDCDPEWFDCTPVEHDPTCDPEKYDCTPVDNKPACDPEQQDCTGHTPQENPGDTWDGTSVPSKAYMKQAGLIFPEDVNLDELPQFTTTGTYYPAIDETRIPYNELFSEKPRNSYIKDYEEARQHGPSLYEIFNNQGTSQGLQKWTSGDAPFGCGLKAIDQIGHIYYKGEIRENNTFEVKRYAPPTDSWDWICVETPYGAAWLELPQKELQFYQGGSVKDQITCVEDKPWMAISGVNEIGIAPSVRGFTKDTNLERGYPIEECRHL